MPRPPSAPRLAALALAIAIGPACRPTPSESANPADPRTASTTEGAEARAEGIRREASRRLASAHVLVPQGLDREHRLFRLAPLIVQELRPGLDEATRQEPGPDRPGRLDPASGSVVASEVPALYVRESSATIDDSELERIEYLWLYPESSEATGGLRVAAVRWTLDAEGWLAIAEVASSTHGARVLWVAQRLEDAARAAFGEPSPERAFSVERPAAELPDLVVAGTFQDGTLPLGPFTYLEHGSRDVVTILCRCSPARVDATPRSDPYDLVVVADAPEALRAALDAILEAAHERGELPDDWDDPSRISRLLRLPPGMR